MASIVCGVYRIRNIVSGRFYIGSSENIYRRFESHRRQLKSGTHKNKILQASWNKHGADAFKFEVLHKVPLEDLRSVERSMLTMLCSHPLNCNMHDETYVFPRTGHKHTDEAKAKISAKVQLALAEGHDSKFIPAEETRKKMSESMKGNQNAKDHVRTEEHQRKLSEANKGNKNFLGKNHSVESRAKMGRAIIATAPDGSELKYPTITELRKDLGMTPPTVNRALKSGQPLKRGRMSGWRFAYAA